MTTSPASQPQAAHLNATPAADVNPRRSTPTNAATIARIAAWNVIADRELPAGTKVTVEDGRVTIHPRNGQPAHVPYGPADTLGSLYGALKDAVRTTTQDLH